MCGKYLFYVFIVGGCCLSSETHGRKGSNYNVQFHHRQLGSLEHCYAFLYHSGILSTMISFLDAILNFQGLYVSVCVYFNYLECVYCGCLVR